MTDPRHRADGSDFGRTAGGAAARGMLLIAAAVVVGFLLLSANDEPAPTEVASAGSTTTTVAPDDGAVDDQEPDQTPQPEPAGPRAPAEVKVLVANASTVKGAAAALSDVLAKRGYNVLSATNATGDFSASVVHFATGYQAEAVVVAEALGLGAGAVAPMPTPTPVDDARGTNVLVVMDKALADAAKAGTVGGGGA